MHAGLLEWELIALQGDVCHNKQGITGNEGSRNYRASCELTTNHWSSILNCPHPFINVVPHWWQGGNHNHRQPQRVSLTFESLYTLLSLVATTRALERVRWSCCHASTPHLHQRPNESNTSATAMSPMALQHAPRALPSPLSANLRRYHSTVSAPSNPLQANLP